MKKKAFKAESKRLLDLMINSIYTHKEIFLRDCMISRLILVVNATPDTAASPAFDTISVSTIPTITFKNCSNISGRINAFNCFLL